jgi:hypothetical protein
MELINDGRYDFQKSLINDSIQDSVVTFSMVDEETGILKVANQEANVVIADENSCEEKFILQYKWKPRDVKKKGFYRGFFEIKFNGDIISEGKTYQEGNLIVPIEEELRIIIK